MGKKKSVGRSRLKTEEKRFRIVNPMPYLILILSLCLLFGIVFGAIFPEIVLLGLNTTSAKERCIFHSDCDWKITNCCPPRAGAMWECVNVKNYKAPECPVNVLCPQVLSPKPEAACLCKEGSCVVA